MVEISPPDDDRAQLLLVGGVALALVIVGTVVLLNGMRFQDTIGSKGNEQALQDALRTEGMIQSDLGNLADEIRADAGLVNYGDQMARNVSTYGGYYSNLTFNDGIVYVNVSLNRSASGEGRLIQQRPSAIGTPPDFRDTNNNDVWTVADEATAIRPFNMTIREFPCQDDPSGPPISTVVTNFTISVNNSDNPNSDYWAVRLNSFRKGGACPAAPAVGEHKRFITVYDETGKIAQFEDGVQSWFPEADRQGTAPIAYDVREGEINGTEINDLEFAQGVDRPWTVEFETETVPLGAPRPGGGWYRIATNSEVPGTNAPSEVDPSINGILAEPAVDIVYQRPELRYNATIYLNGSDQP
jgi:hypothetical protein